MLTILTIKNRNIQFKPTASFSSSADLDEITKMKVNLDKERKEL